MTPRLAIRPLTQVRWADLERLFGPRGACAGCWCMHPRLPRATYEAQRREGNRRALRQLVARGTVPGILAYEAAEPVGGCAIEPRRPFPRLERSRVFRRMDDHPAWTIAGLFVRADRRGRGVSHALMDGAVRHARRRGARFVQARPVEPLAGPTPAIFAWTGVTSAFRAWGCVEVTRRSATHPLRRRSPGAARP